MLGAQVYDDGGPSPFLAARPDVARDLSSSGRVRAILVSGDNGRRDYDEVGATRRYLAGGARWGPRGAHAVTLVAS